MSIFPFAHSAPVTFARRLRAGMTRRLAAASPVVRGAFWIILSGLFFAIMISTAKLAGHRLDAFQVAFFRALFGLAAIMPFIIRLGVAGVRTSRPFLQFARGLFGSTAMLTGFYALVHLPVAEVTAIGFSNPLFMLVLAGIFLGERVHRRRWIATAIGFVGVLVMLRPTGPVDPMALMALFSTFLAACSLILIKTMARNDNPTTIVFYFGVFSTAISAIPAAIVWQAPTWQELCILAAMGCAASAGQSCMVRGYAAAEASLVATFDYLRLVWACLFGYMLFGEVPDWLTLAGAIIIAGSTLSLARREHALDKAGAEALAALADPPPVLMPVTPDTLGTEPRTVTGNSSTGL